jgi:rhamnogalacturonan endolyase
MSGMQKLLDERFDGFEPGLFSADVGPHTEYHYLPEAAPRGAWSVACFADREGGRAWWIEDREDGHAMCQTQAPNRVQTHPILRAGDPAWTDYDVTMRFTPEPGGTRCGVLFRYRNNRSYYFFGFHEDRVILMSLQHEDDFHVPHEVILDEAKTERSEGSEYSAVVSLRGEEITAELVGVCTLTASDETFPCGGIGLLADGQTAFHSVHVTAPADSVEAFAIAKSMREQELDDLRAANPKPVLWKKFATPDFGAARNYRFGDLTGDGRPDLVIGQITHHGPRDGYSEVACITAMNFDGDVLWQSGTPDPDKAALTNDVALQVHDIDGDGRCEVIYARDFELVVADGATGKVKYSIPTPHSKPPADRYERILGDCLFFCDLRGLGRAGDIVIKDRYWHLWAMDDQLNPLWDAACRTGHYPYAFDVDGDGCDELAMGYALFDHDGTMLWNLEDSLQDHADGIAIADFGDSSESMPKIMYAGSDDGMIFVDLNGRIIKHHRVGHVQNPATARFRDDLPGLQTVSVNFWGNQGILHFYDSAGNIYHDCEPLNMGSMCLPINWTGRGTEYFVHNPNPVYGGMFDGWGRPVVMFPDDGHPDMCNAVLDITGDCRDEVVVWNPCEVWVYTQDDNPLDGRLYQPVRNTLANYSNYQATVSLPGWTV